MLLLQDKTPFGVGGRRACYVHSGDSSGCVKDLRSDEGRTIRIEKKKNFFTNFRREYNNNEDEARELERVHRRIGGTMALHLPLCYGYEETDLGPGLILDLICDADGQISRSIRELISTGFNLQDLKPAYDEFGRFLLENVILTRNLHDHNLVAQHLEDGSWRIVLIDGVGDPSWLPLASWIRRLGEKKVRKRLATAWPRMEAFAEKGGVTNDLRKKSSWDQGFLRHRGE